MSLVVRALAKRYGSMTVFCDVSLQVRRGEFVAIVGESGVGKSTLLNCMAGLDSWDQGSVSLDEPLPGRPAAPQPHGQGQRRDAEQAVSGLEQQEEEQHQRRDVAAAAVRKERDEKSNKEKKNVLYYLSQVTRIIFSPPPSLSLAVLPLLFKNS